MTAQPRKKVVLLGLMTKIPVPGVVWQTVHYLIGLQRLGCDVYYVETHASTPSMLMRDKEDDASRRAADFIARVMRRFDLGDRWCFVALHADGRHYGLSRRKLRKLYESASIIINLHGGTKPLPEFADSGRLVYLQTDPVLLQLELDLNRQDAIDLLEPHSSFFTFAENHDGPDCKLPLDDRFKFHPTRQPVVLDFWKSSGEEERRLFTTVGNWKQAWGNVSFRGEVYTGRKHYEFLKFLDLPSRTAQPFELALSGCDQEDRGLLESKGWRVRDALDFSTDVDAYRDYVVRSRGEFTVARDHNVRLRTGWFSDRSATYLAAGRPVITQETGFSNVLPSGRGLFSFSNMDDILGAVERINAEYRPQCEAAAEIAREYFSHDVVLGKLLSEIDVSPAASKGGRGAPLPAFPPDLVLTPTSRRPTKLPDATAQVVRSTPLPEVELRTTAAQAPLGRVSIVVVAVDNLLFTRLCLQTLIANTDYPDYEVIVVDNGSRDDTPAYLSQLTQVAPHVSVILNGKNLGFPAACNHGLALASGDVLVVLNNDTLVPEGAISRLARHLEDPEIGTVGPVTNRVGNEAEIKAPYDTYGGFTRFAQERARQHKGEAFDIPMLAMFCLAMRRDVYSRVGSLDERFGLGMLEDDDYAMRVHKGGLRVVCAEDVFVHHFGETSFGKLVPTGQYTRLLERNQARFRAKWGVKWEPHRRRTSAEYEQLRQRIRATIADVLPSNSTVIVATRGDDQFLNVHRGTAWHFPQSDDGGYAGYYPGDSGEAASQLEVLRKKGGQFLLLPSTAFWWLDYYGDFGNYLSSNYRLVHKDDSCMIYDLRKLSVEDRQFPVGRSTEGALSRSGSSD